MTYLALRAPLELKAAAGSATTLPSRFSGIACSGGKVPGLDLVVDLATTQIAARLPLLAEHAREKIIGSVEAAVVAGGQLHVTGRLFSDLPGGEAERVAMLAQRGTDFELSVGLFGYREERIPAGQNVTVNGRVTAGPATVLRGGHVREVSIVILGADTGAKASIFSSGRKLPTSVEALGRRRRAAERA